MSKSLVVVVWDDAEDPAEGKTWLSEDEVTAFSTHCCTVESVGYLVSKTTKYLTLGGDWIADLQHWGRITKIPTGMVTEIQTLREEK